MTGPAEFALDFMVLATAICVLLIIYSDQYFSEQRTKFRWFTFYILSFLFSTYFLFSADNWFAFLCWWEVITIITTLVIGLSSPTTAWRYFWWQTAGATFLIAGMVFLSLEDATMSIGRLDSLFYDLIIFGLGVKSAIIGFHFWLVPTHAEVGSPSSAFLSGVSIKLGVIPMLYILPDNQYALFVPMGTALFVIGAASALVQRNLKRTLAYSTLSNMGLVYFLLGSSSNLSNTVAQMHIITHVIGKTGLFMTAGLIGQAAGTFNYKDWRRLEFLDKKAVPLGILWATGLLLLSGLPPTMFLTGKHYLEPLVAMTRPISLLFWSGSLFTFAYLFRLISIVLPPKCKTRIPISRHVSTRGLVSTTATYLLILVPILKPDLLPATIQTLLSDGDKLPFVWWKYAIDLGISLVVIATAMNGVYYVTKWAYRTRLIESRPKYKELYASVHLYLSMLIKHWCPFNLSMWMIFLSTFIVLAWSYMP